MGKLYVHVPSLGNTLGKMTILLDSNQIASFNNKGGDVEVPVDHDGILSFKFGPITYKKIEIKADQYSVVCASVGALGVKVNLTTCPMSLVESGKRIAAEGKVIVICNKFYLTTPRYAVFVNGEEIGSVTKDQNRLEIQFDEDSEIVIKEKGISLLKIVDRIKADEIKILQILPSKQKLFCSETILFKDGLKLSKPKPAEEANPSTLKKVGKTLLKHKKAIMIGVGVVAALAGADADAADVDVDADVDFDDDLDFDDDIDLDNADIETMDLDGDGLDDVVMADVDGDGVADAIGMDTDGDGVLDSFAVDTDGNGTLDTFGVDSDGDGVVDTVGMDMDGDGTIDTVGVDADGDGAIDTFGADTDGDGAIDTFGADTDGDGAIDTFGADTDGDGAIDTIGADTDGDGVIDTVGVDTDGDGAIDEVGVITEEENLGDKVESVLDEIEDLGLEDDHQTPLAAGVAAAAVAGAVADKETKTAPLAASTGAAETVPKKKKSSLLWIIPLAIVVLAGAAVALYPILTASKAEEKTAFVQGFFSNYYNSDTDRDELFQAALAPDLLPVAEADPEFLGYLTDRPSDIFETLMLDIQDGGNYLATTEVYGQTSSYLLHVNNKLQIDKVDVIQSVFIPETIPVEYYCTLVSNGTFMEDAVMKLDIEPGRFSVPTRSLTGKIVLDQEECAVDGTIDHDAIHLDATFGWRGSWSLTGSYLEDAIDVKGLSVDDGTPVEIRLVADPDQAAKARLLESILPAPDMPSSELSALMAAADHALQNLPDHSTIDLVDQGCYSPEFRNILSQAYKKSSDEYIEGEIGPDEFLFYWYNGNGDGMDLNSKKFQVTSFGGNSADVSLEMSIEGFPEAKRRYLMKFKKENGKWLLDDWFDSLFDCGMKKQCKQYLEGE